MFRRVCSLSLVLGLAFAVGNVACAQDDASQDAHDRALARTLFSEGVELLDAGEFDAALDRFRRARSLHTAPSILYNLARAGAGAGQLVEASEALRTLLAGEGVDPTLESDARLVLAEIEPRLARLTIEVSGADADQTVLFDDRPVPRAGWGTAMPVDPGTHRVLVADESGEERASAEVTLAEGEVRALTLEVPPEVEPVEVEPVEVEPVESNDATVQLLPPVTAEPVQDDTALHVGLGVALGVVVAVGAVLLVVGLTGGFDTPQPHCGNTSPCVIVAP